MYKVIGLIMCSTFVCVEGLKLTSPHFKDGGALRKEYSCDGKNKAPGLTWSDAPADTKTFALIVDDPDAPTSEPWVHWVVFNLPVTRKFLPTSLGRKGTFSDGTKQGNNTSNHIGYDGPCPPKGKPHRYFFKLYALDTTISLPASITKNQLLDAMKGHILAEAELVGTYQR